MMKCISCAHFNLLKGCSVAESGLYKKRSIGRRPLHRPARHATHEYKQTRLISIDINENKTKICVLTKYRNWNTLLRDASQKIIKLRIHTPIF